MKIERCGSRRNYGFYKIPITSDTIKWNASDQTIGITSWHVRDFNSTSRHTWRIYVTVDEIRRMIDEMASDIGSAEGQALAAALAPSLTSLLRLATECSLHLSKVSSGEATSP